MRAISPLWKIVGEMTIVLKAGDTLMAVRGILHRLRNPGNVENHYLLVFCGWPFRSCWPTHRQLPEH